MTHRNSHQGPRKEIDSKSVRREKMNPLLLIKAVVMAPVGRFTLMAESKGR